MRNKVVGVLAAVAATAFSASEDWTRTVNIKGEKVRFCPDDPGFAKSDTCPHNL